jgi:succinyl-diaminopimelate desuccinylase
MTNEDLLKLAMDLIAIDTTNPPGTQQEAVTYLKEYLEKRGVECSVETAGETPSLFAMIRRSPSTSKLCWIGHWDVVPSGPLDAWTITPPFVPVIRDEHLYGRGACDMKTGVAAAIAAALEWAEDPETSGGTLVLAILADEECGGVLGGEPFLPRYHKEFQFDYGLVGEPTGFDLKTARRGACWGTINFSGIQAHAARPDEGDNPIHKMGVAVVAMSNMVFTYDTSDPAPPTIAVTTARAGNKDNIIPHEATIGFDIRTAPSQSLKSIRSDLIETLQKAGLIMDTDYKLDLNWLADPYATDHPCFSQICSNAIRSVTGRTPSLCAKGGTSDGRFLAALGVPVLEVGLENTTLHKVNECCRVDSLISLKQIYRKIFTTLL